MGLDRTKTAMFWHQTGLGEKCSGGDLACLCRKEQRGACTESGRCRMERRATLCPLVGHDPVLLKTFGGDVAARDMCEAYCFQTEGCWGCGVHWDGGKGLWKAL